MSRSTLVLAAVTTPYARLTVATGRESGLDSSSHMYTRIVQDCRVISGEVKRQTVAIKYNKIAVIIATFEGALCMLVYVHTGKVR